MQEGSVLLLCPSFNSYSSIKFAEIADKVTQEFIDQREDFGLEAMKELPIPTSLDPSQSIEDEEEEVEKQNDKQVVDESAINCNDEEINNNGFEFAFVCNDHESLTVSADEIFSNGHIRPIFKLGPLRKVLPEEGESMPPESDTLARTYCMWKPKEEEVASRERCKKSNSTGTSKRWRLRDLISRSNSDNKETVVFLAHSGGATCSKQKIETKVKSSSGQVVRKVATTTKRGSDVKSAVEIHFMRSRMLKEEDRRRTYLPYRRDIIGFFANVNGLSRNLHPF